MKSTNYILYIILIKLGIVICLQLCENSNQCPRGLKCIKKNENISVCRKKCPIRWACHSENRSSIANTTNSTEVTDSKIQNNTTLSMLIETTLSSEPTEVKSINETSTLSTVTSTINITNLTSVSPNLTKNNSCDICPDKMKCFLVTDNNFTCAFECDSKWACNKSNENNTISDEPLITEEEFNNAMTEAGYYVSSKKYNNIVSLARKAGNITSKRELAMFLAQILWESDGLKAVREYACVKDGCPNEYKTSDDVPGKSYYGRGYIQLTWAGNYKAASHDLFNDDRLYKNPDLVAENEELSWATAFWYWKKHVKPRPGVELGNFGETTDAINGKLECFDGPNVHKAKLRFLLYKKILKGLNMSEEPIEKGCY